MIARVGQRLMEIREPASLLPRRIGGPRLLLARRWRALIGHGFQADDT